MRSTLLLLFIVLLGYPLLHAQQTAKNQKISTHKSNQLLEFDNPALKRADFVDQMYTELGLESAKDLQAKKAIKGLNGWTRLRMQQEYKGLRVVGASYVLHEKNGQIKKSSGNILPYIEVNIKPGIMGAAAGRIAEDYTNSKLLSKTEGAAVVLPEWDIEQAELVVMDLGYPNFSGNYTLAYHVIISNLEGRNQYRESVYINANSGRVIDAISEIAHTSVEGIAITKYYGEQSIITDSLEANLFVLRDYTRGEGIVTLNGTRDDFEDEDNFWDNFGNKEEVGTDAHYCASSYYDFMVDEFSWAGVDGEGFNLESRVYGDERNAVNATWNGRYSTFFSGDCDEYGPLTTLDVVGHEFAHGFTDFTSDLIYRNESGALNESISDILGKALENKYDPENFTWLLGARALLTDEDNHFRDMADPNAKNDPKLYAGEHWEFGASDSGGVHSNSGVLNFWYYLLVEGQAGTNELSVDYDVAPIEFDKATAIVFTMNVAYLNENSTYTKAVTASIEAVKDLYGETSSEMVSVLEAWKAVGLYPNSGDFDLSVQLVEDRPYVCADELDDVTIDVMVINGGLNPYMPGDVLTLSYEIDEILESEEEVVLAEALLSGDTLFYTFNQKPTLLEAGGNFNIDILLEAEAMADPNNDDGELIVTNNTDDGRITTTELVGLDFRVTSVSLTSASACQLEENSLSSIRIGGQNFGCVEIPEGEIPIVITAGQFVHLDTIELRFDLNASNFTTISQLITLPEEIVNGDDITVQVNVANDINNVNDVVEGQFLFLETVTAGYEETFNSFDVFTSTEVFVDPDFRADALVGDINGNSMLIISGTNDEPFRIEDCGELDLFFRENYQKTDIEMCVNTVGVIDPILSFDMIQYRADEAIENIDPSFSAMLKVTIGDTEYPIIAGQTEGVSIKHEYALEDDFSDGILLEAMTLRGAGAAASLDQGDFVLIDNLRITSGSVSTQQTLTEKQMLVYPNPSDGVFHFVQEFEGAYDLTVYDGLGRLIYQAKEVNANSTWDASQADAGIYFYKIQTEKGGAKQGKLLVSE